MSSGGISVQKNAFAKSRNAEIRVRVYRKSTGKWENYGIVSSSRLSWRIKNWFKNLFFWR